MVRGFFMYEMRLFPKAKGKRGLYMRYFYIIGLVICIFMYSEIAYANEKQSIIIEVDGDPEKHQDYFETYHPSVDVITIYDTLFNGLALQAPPKKMIEISSLTFVKATYPVKTYEQSASEVSMNIFETSVIPTDFNQTIYTGKGVKVGVIDTGIDHRHPDIASNYVGGYDLVDLDDDPMETTKEQGIPTLHGTHVAGIIAANGKVIGVAPNASIYAYRALGPGGNGSSIQVIAAMERALKDGVDIMNLSLGNIVNGPDYPTSVAVNRASELGVAVVIANGNNGPEEWTIGAPATATQALSVGALALPDKQPYLYEPQTDYVIDITPMQGSLPWSFTKDYPIVSFRDDGQPAHGKIALMKRSDISFYEKAKQAEDAGALAAIIYNHEDGDFQGALDQPLNIPVVSISKQDGDWLNSQLKGKHLYLETAYNQKEKMVAPFSSRGPVTMNWTLKPELLAPGTNILSTVPGGYQALQGTSMAAPYVTGAIALMKEAQPTWNNQQIINALKTTALRLDGQDGEPIEPISQGMGEIQVEKAIKANTIIDHPLLSFGKLSTYQETETIDLTIENMTNQEKTYVFDVPKKEKGLHWKLPQSFSLAGKERKEIPVELRVTTQQLSQGIHQGWLTLREKEEAFYLPYLFINQTANYPKVMGFSFTLKPFSEEVYTYHLYVTEEAKRVEVNLYEPDTLIFDRRLLELADLEVGVNEGEIKPSEIGNPGYYKALITVYLQEGTIEEYEEELWIE